jgi:hypothetical protein
MKQRGPLIAVGVAVLLLAGGLALLFRLRLGRGDIYPLYSSFRADPLGTRALHDGLGQLPGLRVERSLKPIKDLAATPPRTILFAGVPVSGWETTDTDEFNALDAAVRAGSRVVIALQATRSDKGHSVEEVRQEVKAKSERKSGKKKSSAKKSDEKKSDARPAPEKPGDKKGPGKEGVEKDDPEKAEDPAGKSEPKEEPFRRSEQPEGARRPRSQLADLRKLWGVELKSRVLFDSGKGEGATRTEAGGLPERVPWKSDLYFKAEQGVEWRTLYKRGGEPVLVERTLGRGTLVLAADSFFLSNEALRGERPTALLAWILGPNTRVVFDENHLGVELDPGIAALAKRYGLTGAFFMLLLLAALFVWRRMALFVPPAEEVRDITLSYHPAAGLEALLRRSVAPHELAAVCVTEWKRTARPGDAAKVAAVVAAAPSSAHAAAIHNQALRALRRR